MEGEKMSTTKKRIISLVIITLLSVLIIGVVPINETKSYASSLQAPTNLRISKKHGYGGIGWVVTAKWNKVYGAGRYQVKWTSFDGSWTNNTRKTSCKTEGSSLGRLKVKVRAYYYTRSGHKVYSPWSRVIITNCN
jgi:hypothetical protein